MATAESDAVDPEPLDEVAYRQRNRIGRLFAKREKFRRAATRYEKLKAAYLGTGPPGLWFHPTSSNHQRQ